MERKKGIYGKYIKRLIDIVCSVVVLLIFWWIYFILALLVRIKLGSPVLFRQARPGKDEKIFYLYKFRTMTDDKDENGNLLPDEVRLTKFGKWLRSTSLDELPEVFNILKGEMSLIGPRPLLVRYLPYYTNDERHRHDVRPGLTGLAQVRGRNFITWEEIFKYDLEYVEGCSLFMDIRILFETIIKVVSHSDISDATQGTEDSSGRRVHDALDIERGMIHEN